MSDSPALVLDSPASAQLDSLTSEQKREWRMTGKLPEPKTEAAAPSPIPAEENTQASSDHPPAAEAGKPEGKRESKSENRFQVLTDHNRNLKTELEQTKAELERLRAANSTEKQNGDKKAEVPPSPEKSKAPQMPLIEKYDDLEKYNADLSSYFDALAEFKSTEVLTKRELERQQAEEKKRFEDSQKSIKEKFDARTAVAEKKYPDFKEKIFSSEFSSKIGDVVAGYVLSREKGHDVLYFLHENRPELERIQQLDPFSQAAELTLIELSLAGNGEPSAKKSAGGYNSEIPPPPRELGSGATPPKDAIENAVQKDDFASYKRLANQRDADRLKGRR